MKTTLLVDTESLAIMDAHFTTKKAYDGHIGLQVFRRPETCRHSWPTKCTRGPTSGSPSRGVDAASDQTL